MKDGLLLINLGTPKAPTPKEIRRFLAEFLLDKYVIQIPAIVRYLLVYGIIIPFRIKKTTHAYQAIWDKDGSPLYVNSITLKEKLSHALKDEYLVSMGFRYSEPSINDAFLELKHLEKIVIFPLYPQYSDSTTKTAINKTLEIAQKHNFKGKIEIIQDFYQHQAYLQAQAKIIESYLSNHEFILFSFHSIPLSHILINDCKDLCKNSCSAHSSNYAMCYRAQCIKTGEYLGEILNLSKNNYAISFQSRVGRAKWLVPYTNEILNDLRRRGIETLAVSCPSFVSDCLETLEEINLRLKEQWFELGGKKFTLIPALNTHDIWINSLKQIIKSSST